MPSWLIVSLLIGSGVGLAWVWLTIWLSGARYS